MRYSTNKMSNCIPQIIVKTTISKQKLTVRIHTNITDNKAETL